MERLAVTTVPFNGERFPDRQGAFRDVEDQPQVPAGLQGPRTILYPAWREDPVQAVGHREAAGGELSRCIGIISYLSLGLPPELHLRFRRQFYLAWAFLPAAGFLSISRSMSEDIFRSVTRA